MKNVQKWSFSRFFVYVGIMLQMVLLTTVNAEEKKLPGGLISPQVGAICNEQVKVCYDVFGVSIGITEDIMGKDAADKLTRELSVVDEKYFDRTNFNPVSGVSCHTLEKVCYEGDGVSDILSAALFGASVGKYGPEALVGVSWAWDGSQYNNDTEIRAMDGHNYRLSFKDDGSVQIQADCNRVHGSYIAKGKSLLIQSGPSTRMACGPNSQDQQFLRDLQGVAVWFFKKGDLYLDIKADTGTMRFYRGVAL